MGVVLKVRGGGSNDGPHEQGWGQQWPSSLGGHPCAFVWGLGLWLV